MAVVRTRILQRAAALVVVVVIPDDRRCRRAINRMTGFVASVRAIASRCSCRYDVITQSKRGAVTNSRLYMYTHIYVYIYTIYITYILYARDIYIPTNTRTLKYASGESRNPDIPKRLHVRRRYSPPISI